MNRSWLILLGSVFGIAGGCTLAPRYTRPDAPIPTTFPSGAAYNQAVGAPSAPSPMDLPWQEFFTDERLRKIITITLENNRDLRLAALNVERARGMYGIQRAGLLPAVNAIGSGARSRVPADLSQTGRRATVEQYGADFGIASWELDFFGRIRSLERAALEQYFATEQARRGAQILLVSGVATAYLNLAADRENLKLAQTTLEAQRRSYDLIKRRFDGGKADELDVRRAQTQVETARVDVARFTQQVAHDENLLNLLAGAVIPNGLLPANFGEVSPPKEISAGISSDVLLSRPDILQAENLLRAANANIGAARAAFFPRISLTGTVGTASGDLSGLFNSGSGTWSYAPQVVMPIFDARIWSAAKVSETDKKIAITQYEKAIQESFRDVADALAVYGTVGEQVSAQESLVKAVAETYRLSSLRYDRGVDSYLSVLDAQRSLYSAQRELVVLRLIKAANQVRLYEVFGGGL